MRDDTHYINGVGYIAEEFDENGEPGPIHKSKRWLPKYRKVNVDCVCGHSFVGAIPANEGVWFCPFCKRRIEE